MPIRLPRLTTPSGGSLSGDIVRMPKQGHTERRKQRYTTSDLPLPRGGGHIQVWRRRFVPSLLAWAGTQSDPFGITGNKHWDANVVDIWEFIFPNIVLQSDDMVILKKVVRPLHQSSTPFSNQSLGGEYPE
jgi:hypothetical protein